MMADLTFDRRKYKYCYIMVASSIMMFNIMIYDFSGFGF